MKYKRFYIDSNSLIKNEPLIGEEFFHATKVLRLKINDKICLFCDDEYDYIAQITLITNKELNYKITEKIKNEANPLKKVTLIQALAKNDKLEFITQKATELGASNILPFYSKFSDVKPNTTKVDRLYKIATGACKQCGRSKLTNIFKIENLLDIDFSKYDLVLFANETEKSKKLINIQNLNKYNNIAIIIGPEGGFSNEEIEYLNQNNIVSISLGKRILRTETAGLYVLSYLNEILNI